MSTATQPKTVPNAIAAIDSQMLACVVVTYHPELPVLANQIEALPHAAALVIVDNDSGRLIQDELRKIMRSRTRANLICNDRNLGLAAAVNQGVNEAHRAWPNTQFALLLDQDSEPQLGSVEALLKGFGSLERSHINVGGVGPSLLDITTRLHHGFHQYDRWRWKRVYPEPGTTKPVHCDNLNGSGTLVPVNLFRELGGLDETLFIDHVDTEWSFRVKAAGYKLFGIPNAVFEHRMGDASRRIWLFGWRNWATRSPLRHYYLYRNATILMHRQYVPRVWKIWVIPKLLLTAAIHVVIDTRRYEQLRHMVRGIRQGIKLQRSLPQKPLQKGPGPRNKN